MVNQDIFISEVTSVETANRQKAKMLLDWLATDYQRRTIHEILERQGGICHELAMVTMHFFEKANIKRRKVTEINLHT
ncbi:hypothetical protein ACOKFD_06945 [Flagellimonas sp. S174]|uniref:hypothetical protein n=1 Tax=Flagellimonas sp. S174 TaxID=3410790 RepID=UPI003BF527B8